MHELEIADDVPVDEYSLPGACRRDQFGRPLQAGYAGFFDRHCGDTAARSIIIAEEARIAPYQRNGDQSATAFTWRASSMTEGSR